MQGKDLLVLMGSPRGNIHRLPFVLGYVGIYVLTMLAMLAYVLGSNFIFTNVLRLDTTNLADANPITFMGSMIVGLLVPIGLLLMGLVLFWSHLCLMMKRLRDLKLSPWVVIIPYVSYTVAWLLYMQQTLRPGLPSEWHMTVNVCSIIYLFFLIVLVFWPSRQNT